MAMRCVPLIYDPGPMFTVDNNLTQVLNHKGFSHSGKLEEGQHQHLLAINIFLICACSNYIVFILDAINYIPILASTEVLMYSATSKFCSSATAEINLQ